MRSTDATQVAEMRLLLWPDDDGADGGETVMVWEHDDGSCSGFVALSVRPWADGCREAPVAYVEGWFVRAERRRLGIGRSLIRAAEDWARTGGFGELGSDTNLDNRVSLQAHRRLGFEPTERVQHFRKDLASTPSIEPVTIHEHQGPRSELRALFELAEDSREQLDGYIGLGDVLVATRGGALVGHIQVVPTADGRSVEIKNMAVRPDQQGLGVGRQLVEAVYDRARQRGIAEVSVATATAGLDNLRFYQRMGFRMDRIVRDAFVPATGYPVPIVIDGIELRDQVWFTTTL
jgi:GNAT superfamily N-acetyltransferase